MPTKESRQMSNHNACRNYEKPSDGAWITSGALGSRDAVLVFRTNILRPKVKQPPSTNSSNTSISAEILPSLNAPKADENPAADNAVTKPNSPNAMLPCTSKSAATEETANRLNSKNATEPSNNKILPTISAGQRQLYMTVQKSRKQNFQDSDQNPSKDSISNLPSSGNPNFGEGEGIHDNGKSKQRSKDNELMNNNQGFLYEEYNPGEDQNANGEDDEQAISDDEPDETDEPYSDNMPAVQMKITYKFMQTETKLLRKIFIRHGLTDAGSDKNYNILWTGVHMKPDILRNLAPYQRVNHFPRSYELTRKDRLYKNIEHMQHLRGAKHFDIIPQSFMLPQELRDLMSAHNKSRGPWIVKPAASSRGRGIFIVNTPDQIPQDEQVLVSKYVSDPLCIDGHKCDLRVYVLVTSFDPLIIYLYKEGLVRLATVKYERNTDNLWNPCMHLCNYSINKYHSDYISSSDAYNDDVGHKWTMSALLRHLKSQGCDTQQLMGNIEDLIIKAILSCSQSIISACRMFVPSGNNCFELYGFDILIDDTLKPWLLEINLSPSMGVDSPLDSKVKACLITDVLTCVGIPAFTPSMRAHYDSKWTRFRNVSSTRRTLSAESSSTTNINGHRRTGGRTSSSKSPPRPPLTMEEQRIVRNARLQNARRGGFVRIFPTEDTMQRYGNFLDSATGIPLSTPIVQGSLSFSMILPHNYNQILFNNLYGKESRDGGAKEENSYRERINQYERPLPVGSLILFTRKRVQSKCVEEGKRLRKQIMRLIDEGLELTQLQARQAFASYLSAILRRLSEEPRDFHEKLILKFLNRVGGSFKAPVIFRSQQNVRVASKARSAMVAKLLGDFLEQYRRDTEAYVDSFDHFGMIPTKLFNEFLSHAQESDLEYTLALHTNLTGNMSYLYNRCGLSVPPTPPIPSGMFGFLRALPAMVTSGSGARDFTKYDGYYKSNEINGVRDEKLPVVTIGKGTFSKQL